MDEWHNASVRAYNPPVSKRRTKRVRPSRWIAVVPWLFVAVLAHIGAMLVLFVWRPEIGPPEDPITIVSLTPIDNPYAETAGLRETPPGGETIEANIKNPATPPNESDPDQSPPDTANTAADPRIGRLPASVERALAGDTGGIAGASRSGSTALDPYANRSGEARGDALGRYGGDDATESAVRAGLEWLAAHQEADGSWDRVYYDLLCPEADRCRETAAVATQIDSAPAVTGLALLAFLGSGHTHLEGDYRDGVARGLRALLDRQLASGSFSPSTNLEMYNHTIATLAVAEAYGITHDPTLASPLSAAVTHLVRAQQSGGGWDYKSDLATGRNDMSITGWAVMALKSAATAGVRVPEVTLLGVIDFVTDATDIDGYVYYANVGTGTVVDNAANTLTRRYGPATTAIGAVVRQALGWRADATVLKRQTALMLGEPPDVDRLRGGDPSGLHSEYYWFYGTLAVFNQGGDAWATWNVKLRSALLSTQDRPIDALGNRRHSFGSWPAFGRGWGKWGRTGSRIYSTTLAVMMLESYYRYVPAYVASPALVSTSTLRTGMAGADRAHRVALVRAATDLSVDVGEPILVDALGDTDARIRVFAAIGLTRHGSPLGEAVLRQARPGTVGGELAAVDNALDRIAAMSWAARYGLVIRSDPNHRVIVFETLGQPVYYGLELGIERDGVAVGRVRVTRRFDAHHLAAGEVIAAPPDGTGVSIGDVVVSLDNRIGAVGASGQGP